MKKYRFAIATSSSGLELLLQPYTEEKQFLETILLKNMNFKIYIFNYFVLSLQVLHSLILLFY